MLDLWATDANDNEYCILTTLKCTKYEKGIRITFIQCMHDRFIQLVSTLASVHPSSHI